MSKPIKIEVSKEELSLVEDNSMNAQQLAFILKKTPALYVRSRPAKGGGKWNYVSGYYMKKVLNLMFGWDWDFQVLESYVEFGEVTVLGRLTCRAAGKTIIKEQYGNKDIMYRKGTKEPLSIGNDRKAAATDALKKCAAELGIANDVYAPDEFKAVTVTDEDPKEKEKQRIIKFIETTTDVDQLNQVPQEWLMDEDVMNAAQTRQQELS